MKKLLVCLLGAVILTNCEIGPRKANAQKDWARQINLSQRFGRVEYVVREIQGMEYIIGSNSSTYSSPFFVNLTLEKLQVEKNKLEIELLKKQLSQ